MSYSRSPEQQQIHRRKSLSRRLSTKQDVPSVLEEGDEEEDTRGRSTSKSPRINDKVSYTFDEGEVEANLYFPTFARRGSDSRERLDRRRSSTASRSKRESIDRLTSREAKDDDDTIFALDQDEISLTEHSMRSPSKPVRRVSDQSISSISTSSSDLNMVWDEEDRDDTIRAGTRMARQGSGSSIHQALNYPTRSKLSQSVVMDVVQIPILPFARTIRRPSLNIMTPLQSYQWGVSARERSSNTTIVARSNSVTSIHFDLAKESLPEKQIGSKSVSSSPNTDRGSPFVSQHCPLQAEQKPLRSDVVGRKRSCTDPFEFQSLLNQYRVTKLNNEGINPDSASKEHLCALDSITR